MRRHETERAGDPGLPSGASPASSRSRRHGSASTAGLGTGRCPTPRAAPTCANSTCRGGEAVREDPGMKHPNLGGAGPGKDSGSRRGDPRFTSP
jgi:hypothetical protein